MRRLGNQESANLLTYLRLGTEMMANPPEEHRIRSFTLYDGDPCVMANSRLEIDSRESFRRARGGLLLRGDAGHECVHDEQGEQYFARLLELTRSFTNIGSDHRCGRRDDSVDFLSKG